MQEPTYLIQEISNKYIKKREILSRTHQIMLTKKPVHLPSLGNRRKHQTLEKDDRVVSGKEGKGLENKITFMKHI